ncbi:hypothetical protein LOD99_3872 [Oopsacas minuta]|uniref:Uncharacterized protein n=1 Tax=Oopsacas minuta TaxID=111878 RepID=A0AAV7JYI1_9METZ|nr:hypothetical protein LOD99_3872 [Oopsacas minuta]
MQMIIPYGPHHPNSPFCTRPVVLLTLPEIEESVKFLMDSVIYNETSTIEESGLCLHNGNAEVKIIRSHFDTKMAKVLSGAGGANCQMRTATFQQIHDISIVQNGFPINRTISDARDVFDEVDEEEYLSLPTNKRFNLIHKPISGKDITSASPLHTYLRTLSWFLFLICHLQCGAIQKWSPPSPIILGTKKFITSLIEENLVYPLTHHQSMDEPPQPEMLFGDASHLAMILLQDFLYWVLTVVLQETYQFVSIIFDNLSAILRLYNSNRKVDTEGS